MLVLDEREVENGIETVLYSEERDQIFEITLPKGSSSIKTAQFIGFKTMMVECNDGTSYRVVI